MPNKQNNSNLTIANKAPVTTNGIIYENFVKFSSEFWSRFRSCQRKFSLIYLRYSRLTHSHTVLLPDT